MAQLELKHPLNVPGPIYVDTNCIGCGLCWITARGIFKADDHRRAYVVRQPVNQDEYAEVFEAMADCPEQAIGDNGGPPDLARQAGL